MEKIKRNDRVAAISKILSSHPNRIFTLSYFSQMFNTAKSTISEDIAIIKKAINHFSLGDIETVAGAAGGIRYQVSPSYDHSREFVEDLCEKLSESQRMLPGGFLYMNDIIHKPETIRDIGQILASSFKDKELDFILTVETKGIPVALMTAHFLGCPLVVARKKGNVTEGPNVSINYATATSGRLETMYLSKKAIEGYKRALIIDDFMRGGGTAKGMQELLKEFSIDIVGVGVVIATSEPKAKLVDDYFSLVELVSVDQEKKRIEISPSRWFSNKI